MPKKLNKGGQPQEYVPSGNGDASGEYADDNGSNRHFTSFKKPEDTQVETGKEEKTDNFTNVVEDKKEEPTPVVEEKKKGRYDELTDSQKKALVNTILSYKVRNRELNVRTMRFELKWYGGSYGDYSRFSDEEIDDIINYVNSFDFNKSNEMRYIQKGKNWFETPYWEDYEKLGVKTFTQEQMDELIGKKHQKDITNSKVQQEIFDNLKKRGFNAVISLKGINDENSKAVGRAINRTLDDFDELKNYLVSFGTERGLSATVEELYNNHEKSQEYGSKLNSYFEDLKRWNPGRTITLDKAKELYKTKWIKDNTHTSSQQFWGCCGREGEKSWIQLKNTQYNRYQEENEKSLERYGYPNNIGASFESTTYHELGHAICNMLLKPAMFGEYWDTETIDKIREIKRKYNKPISSYGRKDIAEYIAECFSSHYTYGDNEQANEVFNTIMEVYRRRFAK